MNRKAKSFVMYPVIIFGIMCFCFPNQTALSSALTETPSSLRLHTLQSKIFANTRQIRVLLPPGYDLPANRSRRYPVLYLNDGQNLFNVSTSVFNPMEWKADETSAQLIKQKLIMPLIIVGVDNAGRRGRANEYLPYEDKFLTPALPMPDGKKFPTFLTDEVMPFVNQIYRTRTDEAGTGIGGSSYGAIAALFTVMTKPGVFGKLLLESPSLYIKESQLLKDAQNASRWPDKVYIGVGTNEEGQQKCRPGDRSQDVVQDALKLERTLRNAGLDKHRLVVRIEECAAHNETAWAGRFPVALKFLYGTKKNGQQNL